MSCVFCKIIKKELSAKVVFENDKIIAFYSISPVASVHILVIPKRHINSIVDIKSEDLDLMGELILTAKKIADDFDISQSGYKLLFRVGVDGGQEIQHIHLHLMGGKK